MRKIATIFVVTLIVLCITRSVSAQDQKAVTITADPINRVVSSPRERVNIRVIIRIEPNRNNRNLIFEYDSEDGEYGRKDIQLDGENSPRIFNISDARYFGREGFLLSAGHYKLRATVERSTGKNEVASVEVTIIAGEEIGQDGR